MRLSKHRVASLALVFVTVITTLYLHLPGQKKAIHGWRISNSIYLAASNHRQFEVLNEINLAFVLDDPYLTEQLYTVVKSILYYQGRFQRNRPQCELNVRTLQNKMCPKVELPPVSPLHLHLLVPDEIRIAITDYFKRWNLPNVRISFYELNLTELSMSRDPLLSLWLKKLCWQEILPNQVKQVISLDADVMFNRNIQDLWNIFNDFSDEQMIGGVFELTDYLRTHMTKLGYPTIKTGVNAGMLLLHLERIRHSNWSVTWRSVKREMHSNIGEVPFHDQGVLNTMIYRRPSLFHEIPCEWNIVAKLPFADNTYPVIWVVKHPGRADCVTGEKSRNQKLHLASLVHVAGTPKPETVFRSSKPRNYSPVIKYTAFTAAKFREVFMEVYSAFRTMDKGCFY